MTELLNIIKEHPSTSGMLSTVTGMGFSLVGLLSQEETVRIIGSIGGLCGIVLTLVSLYYKVKSEMHKKKR
jgi:lantibiotic modifying enzyme